MHDEMGMLKEVGSIVAGHGGIALSEILGRKVILDIPHMDVVPRMECSFAPSRSDIGIGIFSRIAVGLKGEVVVLLDEKNAFKLINLSYKLNDEEKKLGAFTELGLSLVKEIGNIVIGAYLNSLSLFLKRMIIPSLPTLISGVMENIINIIIVPQKEDDYNIVIEVTFEEPIDKIRGSFYLVLTQDAVVDIQQTCRKILNDLEK